MFDFYHFIVPAIEVSIIAVLIYYLLSFFWNTRAMDAIFGILAFIFLFLVAQLFSFPVVEKLLYYFASSAVVALIVLFQPELRLVLSKLSVKGKKYREITEFDHFLDGIAHAIYRLSDRKYGALVVLENQDSLDEYANKAVVLKALFSSEILESIFVPTTPLHDGAVIIRGTEVLSAATILPLADDSTQLSKSMGTRHRAGLGVSQLTDALIIVVSEETGKVSVARDGIMTRGVKIDRFKGIIRSIFTPPKTPIESSIDALGWFKEWRRKSSW